MRALVVLGVLGALMLVLRIVYVIEVPDLDTDSYGHFHVGRALLDDPFSIPIHWVWLPGWHFALMLFQRIGLGFQGVRIVQAILATLGPVLVYIYARKEEEKLLAALLFTLASLANLAGTSALMEVAFTFLVLGGAIAIDRPRVRDAILAGVLIALACSIRYEAWFIVIALGGSFVVTYLKTKQVDARFAITCAIPAGMLGAYVIFRRVTDGEWLWFIRETYRFTHMQRGLSAHSAIFDLLWFPLILPLMVLGPAILLIPLAFTKPPKIRRSIIIPLSLLAFLLITYVGKGALGQARYLTVLMPFACTAIASGVSRIKRHRSLFFALSIASVAGSLLFMVQRTASSALASEAHFRDLEVWAASPSAPSSSPQHPQASSPQP